MDADPSHLSEGARRRPCYRLVQVVEKINHHSDELRLSASAATSIGTDVGVGVSE
jgi:hypothetical protein